MGTQGKADFGLGRGGGMLKCGGDGGRRACGLCLIRVE